MRPWMILVLIVSLAPVFAGADLACGLEPSSDTIVVTSPISLRGLYLDDKLNSVDGSVQVQLNGVNLAPVQATAGNWLYPSIDLAVGVNTFAGTTMRPTPGGPSLSTVTPFQLERRTDLVARGTQNIFLDFTDANFDVLMRQIAVATLEPDPTPAQLQAFPEMVRTGIRAFFNTVYSLNNVVQVPANGLNVTRVQFDSTAVMPNLFGQSPLDYTNLNKTQTSMVFVTTFKTAVVDQNQLLTQTPARLTDTFDQRVGDIATLIGRTGAHELGHALGLVRDGEAFLKGCMGSHNCPDYDATHPLANRFDVGHFVMDPGPMSQLFARVGFATRMDRTARPPIFNNYNKSYIGHID